MTVSLRAAPLACVFLLALVGAWSPPTSIAQTTSDTAAAASPPSAVESLRASQPPFDSLGTTPSEAHALTDAQVGEPVQSLSRRALWTVMILVLTYFAARGAGGVLEFLAARSTRPLFIKQLLPLLRLVLWATAFYVVLRGLFHIAPEQLLIAAAAIGLVVGVAAQDLLKNIVGGLVLAFNPPFQVGDWISVDDTRGTVTAIGLRATHITTPDDTLVSVPNALVVNGQVASAQADASSQQVVTHLHLPGTVDATKAKELAHAAATSSMYVSLKEPVVVHVCDAFEGRPLIHLQVQAYVFDARYEALLTSDVTERARRAFRKQGLLPSPDGTPTPADARPLPQSKENNQTALIDTPSHSAPSFE